MIKLAEHTACRMRRKANIINAEHIFFLKKWEVFSSFIFKSIMMLRTIRDNNILSANTRSQYVTHGFASH
jgi:hypothetical protein